MKNSFKKYLSLSLITLGLLALPEIVSAQIYFTDTQTGDVVAGFRKTGTFQESYEMIVYLGNITNFLALPAGATTNISNYSSSQLSTMCPDGFGNLHWSVFAGLVTGNDQQTPVGFFPGTTTWYTIPRTNNVPTTAFTRTGGGSASAVASQISGVSDSAFNTIAPTTASSHGGTNADNNTLVLLESVSVFGGPHGDVLSNWIGDQNNLAYGDFSGIAFNYNVENTTSNNFTSPAVSDFYEVVPNSSSSFGPFTDPYTGQTNGLAYNVGQFTLNPSGTMTFTRASAVTAPAISSVAGTATNGFSPLQIVFSTTTTGTITSYVWNFGNGVAITNTTGGSVTNTYSTNGSFTVTLTVYGPGGSSSQTLANYVVASPKPKLSSLTVSGTKFVWSGTNGPVGMRYRILSATNVTTPVANWVPVLTNTISATGGYGFTNNAPTNRATFFRLVSP